MVLSHPEMGNQRWALRDEEQTMEPKEIANRLLIGSRNIDKMRKAIEETMALLAGFVRLWLQGSSWTGTGRKDAWFGYYFWEVYRLSPKESFGIRCCVDDDATMMASYVLCDSNKQGTASAMDIRVGDVQEIYANLHVLVKAIVEEFPGIENRWKPLIDASDVDIS